MKRESYRHHAIGKTSFDRYSQKAAGRMSEELKMTDMNEVWSAYRSHLRRRPRA